MEEFGKNWLNKAQEDIVDATLTALTVAALRHSNETYKNQFISLWNVINDCSMDNKYFQKLRDIYLTILPKPVKKEEFKKWWE